MKTLNNIGKFLAAPIHKFLNKRLERKLDKAFQPLEQRLQDARLKLLIIQRLQG